MIALFLQIIHMGMTASCLVLAVILLRILLKKIPKRYICILWTFVAIRLLFPFSIESAFSLIPTMVSFPDTVLTTGRYDIDTEINPLSSAIPPVLYDSIVPNAENPTFSITNILTIASTIWIIGMAVMLLYLFFSYARIKKNVQESICIRENLWICDHISTPFILGIIKPRIYLPSSIEANDMPYVISHEEAHIKRLDYIWKPLGFLLLTVYWFHPALWLASILLCRDIELACDEKVIQALGTDIKKPYAEALINCSISQKMITACPLAFGEVAVKERVKHVLNYKRPAFWMIAVAITVCIAAAVCLLTNPSRKTLQEISGSLENINVVFAGDTTSYESVENYDKELLTALAALHISTDEISLSRDEYRDRTNTLMLHDRHGTNGIFIHFNKDFTEVWVNDSVKPSFSYRVLEPETARKLYSDFCKYIVPSEPEAAPLWGLTMDIQFDNDKEFTLIFRTAENQPVPEGTLTTSDEYYIKAIYDNKIISFGEYMRSLGYDYADPDYSFPENAWNGDVHMIKSTGVTRIPFKLQSLYGTLPAGQYVICKPVTLTSPDGTQTTHEYQTMFAVIDDETGLLTAQLI